MARTKTKSWPKWPTKKDEPTVKKLLDWFKSDFTVEEAVSYAGISKQTFYNRLEDDKQFVDAVEAAKNYCFIMAKNNVRKWLNEWDKEYSLKWLKNRQNKIYSEKIDNEVNVTVDLEKIRNMSDEELYKLARPLDK